MALPCGFSTTFYTLDLDYVSLPSSFLCRAPKAISGSSYSSQDLNLKLRITFFPAGPQPRAKNQSVPRRTSTASSGSKCSPPDCNRELGIKVFPAGPQPRAPGQPVPRWTSTTKKLRRCNRYAMYKCQKECHKLWHLRPGC